MKRWIHTVVLVVLIACVVNVGVLNQKVTEQRQQLVELSTVSHMNDMFLNSCIQNNAQQLSDHANAVRNVIRDVMPSTVSICAEYQYVVNPYTGEQLTVNPQDNAPFGWACGGVVIDESGIILTAAHVVDDLLTGDPNLHPLSRVWVEFEDGTTRDIKYIAYSEGRHPDVGVVWIDPNGLDLKAVPLNYDARTHLTRGEPIVVIGSPVSQKFSVEIGIVASPYRDYCNTSLDQEGNYLQISAHITGGNSGGPVYDLSGNFLGLVSFGYRGTGVQFVVPVDVIMKDGLMRCCNKERVDVPQ